MLESLGPILSGIGQAAGGAASLFGGNSGGGGWQQLAIMREQAQLQREFAQNGIQWRVNDAKAAGIHPLYALGGGGASYSPSAVHVGDRGNNDLGRDLANMGQGLGRAVAATASKEDRSEAAYTAQVRAENLKRLSLENQNLELQIAASQGALMRAQVGPPMPTGPATSRPDAHGVYEAKPPEVANTHPAKPGSEAGPQQPGLRYVSMRPDGRAVVSLPSQSMQIDELSSPGAASFHYWNSILPYVSKDARDAARPPNSMLPEGASHWRWTPFGYVAQYPDIPGRDLRRGSMRHYFGPRASTYPLSRSGAER